VRDKVPFDPAGVRVARLNRQQTSIEVNTVATNAVSAVLFAKSSRRVATFYREVLGARSRDRGERHESLECHGFHLLVQQIPDALAEAVEISTPPHRRERTAVRLDFPVADIATARLIARRLGGHIDEMPPPWAGDSTHIYLGYDPEGNVIGLTPANTSFERTHEG
jgi:predicted enzyme related to lactoylglutathione lyase